MKPAASPKRRSPGDRSPLDRVGVEAEHAAGRDRVEPVVVAQVVERGHLGEVVEVQVRPQQADRSRSRPRTRVPRRRGSPMPQRIVQFGQPYVATRAALTRSPSTCQASGWCVCRKLWTGSAATSLHQGRTPVVPWIDQAASLSIAWTVAQVVAPELLHRRRECLRDGPGALHHDRLEELGAHHGAHAGPAARAPLEAADDREVDHVLAALADVQDADALPVAGVDPVVRRHRALAPDLVGRQELDAVVLDREQRGPLGAALDDEGVVARLAELVGDPRAEVPVAVAAGRGRLGGHDRLAGVRGGDAGDGADGDHQLVLRAERIDPGRELVVEDLDGEAAAADPGVWRTPPRTSRS